MTGEKRLGGADRAGCREGEADRLERAVDRLGDLYARLDALSRRQRELIARSDGDALLGLLREREGLIEQITQASGVLREASDGERESARGVGVSERLDAIKRLAAEIAERDAEDNEAIKARRDALADRLAGVGRGRAAVSAYGGAKPVVGPRFHDRRG